MHEHDIVRNAELRKFRREQLLQRQNLEKVLLTEVRMMKATMSWFVVNLEKFSLSFSSWSCVVRVNLLHPCSVVSLVFFYVCKLVFSGVHHRRIRTGF